MHVPYNGIDMLHILRVFSNSHGKYNVAYNKQLNESLVKCIKQVKTKTNKHVTTSINYYNLAYYLPR